jgi:hypothetical protein
MGIRKRILFLTAIWLAAGTFAWGAPLPDIYQNQAPGAQRPGAALRPSAP